MGICERSCWAAAAWRARHELGRSTRRSPEDVSYYANERLVDAGRILRFRFGMCGGWGKRGGGGGGAITGVSWER